MLQVNNINNIFMTRVSLKLFLCITKYSDDPVLFLVLVLVL